MRVVGYARIGETKRLRRGRWMRYMVLCFLPLMMAGGDARRPNAFAERYLKSVDFI